MVALQVLLSCVHVNIKLTTPVCLNQATYVGTLILRSCLFLILPWSCHAGPLGMPELLSMAVKILEGLVQLHAIHVWHLDLKPAGLDGLDDITSFR